MILTFTERRQVSVFRERDLMFRPVTTQPPHPASLAADARPSRDCYLLRPPAASTHLSDCRGNNATVFPALSVHLNVSL